MSFWMGAMQDLSNWRQQEAERNLQQETQKRQGEEKIALTLLESDDPDVQMAGLSILQAAMQPPQKKRGVRGSIGEYETTAGLEPLLALANQFRGLTEGRGAPETPAVPGGAALPAGSPVEPKMQQGPNPGLLQQAAGATGDAGLGAMGAFGGVPMGPSLNAPQQFAGDQSISPNGTINMGQIAGRVSRDRGIPRPGERARLFWPTKASQAAAQERAKFDTQIQTLQALGATPQQILSAVLASQGLAQGAATTSGEEWVMIPGQPDPVLAFHYRDPRTQQAFMAYTGPDGQPTPLPPGATRAPSQSSTANPRVTATQLGQEIMAQFPEMAGRLNPDKRYRYIVQDGKVVEAATLEDRQEPQPPFPFGVVERGANGEILVQTRDPNNPFQTIQGSQRRVNPRLLAARALIDLIGAQEKMSGLGTDIADLRRATEGQMRPGQWRFLEGLDFEQIKMLADRSIPLDATNEMLDQIIQMGIAPPPGAGPAAAPPAAPGTKPQARVPQGDNWVEGALDYVLSKPRPTKPGTVQGRHTVR